MRKMDQNRKAGTVTGMPGVTYWQDGCYFDHEFNFVKSEYTKTATEETLAEEMKPKYTFREPGSPAYSEAYQETVSMTSSAVRAKAAQVSQAIGSHDGQKLNVYSGTGSKQKNSKTVAMFKLE